MDFFKVSQEEFSISGFFLSSLQIGVKFSIHIAGIFTFGNLEIIEDEMKNNLKKKTVFDDPPTVILKLQ